jgi:hypothetical protein
MEDLGICSYTSYSINKAVEINDNKNKKVKLLQLQIGNTKFEWKGKWSDNCPEWTPKIKERLNYTPAPDDGIFWMELMDFRKFFINVHLCKFVDGYKYTHFRMRETPIGYHLIAINVEQNGDNTFSIS